MRAWEGELISTKTYKAVEPMPLSFPARFGWGPVTLDARRMPDGVIRLTDGLGVAGVLGVYFDPDYFVEVP